MATTIEQLELEVRSNAGSAVSGIEALSNALAKLKSATKGGVGLTTVANQFNKFNSAMTSLDSSSASKINALADSLSRLKSLNGIKLSSTLAKQISAIGAASNSIAATDFSGLANLTTALAPLSSFKASGFTTAINALNRLPKVSKTLDSMNLGHFTSQIQKLSTALAPLATQLDTIGNAFNRLPTKLQSVVTATNRLSTANQTASMSYINLYAKAKMAIAAVRGIAGAVAGWLNSSNQYIEDMNLFAVSMGDAAGEAQAFAEKAGEALGINPGEFMRNQGVFNTIISGFGVASDKAALMSKNLTQLGYDISSFYNISYTDAIQKLQSGISGELEPLRRIGYDLSVARLQEEAYALGIQKSVSAMTQAEKSQLRYHAIMTQVTQVQGDMARTLESPANQIRILKAQLEQCSIAIGNLFLPALQAILPYAIAVAKVIRYLAQTIASFFGIKMQDYTSALSSASTSVGGVASGADDAASGLKNATGAAKKLKAVLLGIDELNVYTPNSDSSGSGGAGGVGGGDLGIDLPTYDFFKDLAESKANKIFEEMKKHLKDILELAGMIGTAFLSWKIADGIIKALQWLSTLKGFNLAGSIGFKIAGLGAFLDGWKDIKEAVQDIIKNGANFTNVTKLISGFAKEIGAAFVFLGNIKLAGAAFVIAGVTGIMSNISDIIKNGANFDNVTDLVKNIGFFISGIGMLTGSPVLAGGGMILAGVTILIQNLGDVMEAIRTGDWSGVDKISIVSGIALLIGGVIVAFKTVKTVAESASAISSTATAVRSVASTTQAVSTSVSQGLNPALVDIAKNLLLGIGIIAEVAGAAILIVGAIFVLGEELKLVANAWTPVIENGGTVLVALASGSALLVAVGVATAALGTVGTGLAANIGIGTLLLTEVSVATDLFAAEIAAIGGLLGLVAQAWTPVIANAPTVETGIVTGTALLVAIGVATAALGLATVASAGTIPLAIGLGTALLVELSGAFVIFCESLKAVAKELSEGLAPELVILNGALPSLTTNMHNFVQFMKNFANEVVAYTKADVIASLASTIDTIIGWFTTNPISKLTKDVNDVYEQTKDLNDKLNLAVPELKTAVDLLTSYNDFLQKLSKLSDSNVELSSGLYLNLYEIGKNLVTGFVEGIRSQSSSLSASGTEFVNTLLSSISTAWNGITSFFTSALTNLETNVRTTWTSIQTTTSTTWTTVQTNTTTIWTSIQQFLATTWNTIQTNITTSLTAIHTTAVTITTSIASSLNAAWTSITSQTLSAWSQMVSNAQQKFAELNSLIVSKMNEATNFLNSVNWGSIGSNLVNGLLRGLQNAWDSVTSWVSEAASDLTRTMQDAFDIHSPSRVWAELGMYLDLGLQEGMQGGVSGLVSTANQIANTVTTAATPTIDTSPNIPTPTYRVDTATYSNPNATDSSDSNGIATILEQMLAYMQSENRDNDVKVVIDGREVFNAVVKENNRAIQRTGVSPIRV